MSYFKLFLVALGGMFTPGTTAGAEVVSYLLKVVSAWLSSIKDKNKEKITKVLSVCKTCLVWLNRVQSWIPAKWQSAYKETVEAVEAVVYSLEDFNITDEEFAKVKKEFEEARDAWESDDEEEGEGESAADTASDPDAITETK